MHIFSIAKSSYTQLFFLSCFENSPFHPQKIIAHHAACSNVQFQSTEKSTLFFDAAERQTFGSATEWPCCSLSWREHMFLSPDPNQQVCQLLPMQGSVIDVTVFLCKIKSLFLWQVHLVVVALFSNDVHHYHPDVPWKVWASAKEFEARVINFWSQYLRVAQWLERLHFLSDTVSSRQPGLKSLRWLHFPTLGEMVVRERHLCITWSTGGRPHY